MCAIWFCASRTPLIVWKEVCRGSSRPIYETSGESRVVIRKSAKPQLWLHCFCCCRRWVRSSDYIQEPYGMNPLPPMGQVLPGAGPQQCSQRLPMHPPWLHRSSGSIAHVRARFFVRANPGTVLGTCTPPGPPFRCKGDLCKEVTRGGGGSGRTNIYPPHHHQDLHNTSERTGSSQHTDPHAMWGPWNHKTHRGSKMDRDKTSCCLDRALSAQGKAGGGGSGGGSLK